MPEKIIARYRNIQSEKLCVVKGHDTLRLLMDADVMLCDTSSIISEFRVLLKPVVTFRNLAPQPYMINVRKPDEIGTAIERALHRPQEIMCAIDRHARETHPRNDGLCSERIVVATERMVSKGLGHLRPKPRNLLRHWAMRKALHYYRFADGE